MPAKEREGRTRMEKSPPNMIDTIETIGLYGGSFNPPHMAHVLVAAWALATGEVGKVWVIPTGGHPFGKKLAPFEDRQEMCRRAFYFLGDCVQILDIEREPRVHYSIETLRELQQRHPDSHWRWIMGSDTLEDAPQWREFDELMRLAPPLIIPRQGYGNSQIIDSKGFALPNISSTLLRRRLAEGPREGLDALIPGAVLEWIRQRGLYQRESELFNSTCR